jgi:hypothetical protein
MGEGNAQGSVVVAEAGPWPAECTAPLLSLTSSLASHSAECCECVVKLPEFKYAEVLRPS